MEKHGLARTRDSATLWIPHSWSIKKLMLACLSSLRIFDIFRNPTLYEKNRPFSSNTEALAIETYLLRSMKLTLKHMAIRTQRRE
jgi:hypothetical protein